MELLESIILILTTKLNRIFTTSADLMTQRSLLYRLLAEIYFFFDAMDVDGLETFADFPGCLEASKV